LGVEFAAASTGVVATTPVDAAANSTPNILFIFWMMWVLIR